MSQPGSDGSRQAAAESIAREFEIGSEEIQQITKHLGEQIKRGLKAKYSYQIPSFVTQIPDGQEKGLFLAVDLGGTNCRVCAVNLHGDSSLDVFQTKHVIPAHVRVNPSYKPLFQFIAERIQVFLEEYNIQGIHGARTQQHFNLGFTFSFTCEQTSVSGGTIVHWDKGWDIPSALGRDPCALLQDAIDDFSLPIRVCVLANDAVGTLLARAYTSKRRNSTLAAIILGTGTNAAYVEKISNVSRLDPTTRNTHQANKNGIMVMNTEWGSWDDEQKALPRTRFDRLIDESSSDPGCGLLEKMVSGMYLGELLRLTLVELAQHGLLDMTFGEDSPLYKLNGIDSTFLTKATAFNSQDSIFDSSCVTEYLAASNVSAQDLRLLQLLSQAIVQRSARLVGAGLAAIIIQSGRLHSAGGFDKSVNRIHTDEVEEKSVHVQKAGVMASVVRFLRATFGCFHPRGSPSTATCGSKDTIESSVLLDQVIDIAVDGSLFEYHAGYETFMRSALRDVPDIGVANEAKINIELTRDGSGTGAALIAAVTGSMT